MLAFISWGQTGYNRAGNVYQRMFSMSHTPLHYVMVWPCESNTEFQGHTERRA